MISRGKNSGPGMTEAIASVTGASAVSADLYGRPGRIELANHAFDMRVCVCSTGKHTDTVAKKRDKEQGDYFTSGINDSNESRTYSFHQEIENVALFS